MSIFRSRLVILVVTLLLAVVPMPLFCQSGPPPLPPLVLDIWLLDQPDWGDAFGDPAISFTNLNVASGWDRGAQSALSVDTNCAAFLNYPVFDEGYLNITLPAGTIYFWYQPNFTSTTDGGNGPTNWASLLTVGQWTSNASASCWILAIDPAGTNLVFLAQSNGNSQIAFRAPIDFDAGNWYSICLTYSNTGCCLYLGGQPFISGGAITNFPSTNDCATYGFYVGSEGSNGVFQARGQFQDLETYDGPMTALEIYYNYAYDSNQIANSGGTLIGSGGGFHGDGDPSGGGGSGSGGGDPPLYSTNEFWLQPLPLGTNAYNSNPNALTFILWDTTNTSSYQLWTTTNLANPVWTPQPVFVGASGQNWTPITFLPSAQSTLFFEAINYSQDTTDSGLPDWWKIQNGLNPNVLSSSTNGVSDAYADPAGDGWPNIYKFQHGMNPNVFYTPPAPTVSVAPAASGSGVLITWEPSLGNVTGYLIYRDGGEIASVSASTTSYLDSGISVSANSASLPYYQVVASYSGPSGTVYSAASAPQTPASANLAISTAILRGAMGQYYLAAPNIPNIITNLRLFATPAFSEFPNILFDIYSQPMSNFNSTASASYLDFPTTQFTNGMSLIPQSFIPYYNSCTLNCVPMGANNTFGPQSSVGVAFFQYTALGSNWYNTEYSTLYTQQGGFWGNLMPFLDGSTQLRQNLIFQLQTADEDYALEFDVSHLTDTRPTLFGINDFSDVYFLPNYAWANFHARYDESLQAQSLVNEFQPFEDNYFYRNFVLQSVGDLNPDGSMASGVTYGGGGYHVPPTEDNIGYSVVVPSQAPYAFPDYAFAAAGTTNPPASILSTNAQTVFSTWPGEGYIGITPSGTTNITFAAGQQNLFGLPYESVTAYYSTNDVSLLSETLLPGETAGYPAAENVYFYPQVSAPTLATVGYFFGLTDRDLLPGDYNFTPMMGTVAPIIATPGTPLLLGAWAEQSINGSTNRPGFIEQYFDKCYSSNYDSGFTTNALGVLSEYGEFFPTDPGLAILTTKTNSDGTSGTLEVPVIGLYADRNHDGVIDTSFSGPDFCTPSRPFQFWFNDDDDAGDTGGDDIPGRPASIGKIPNGLSGMVNGTRDLNDFFPVYVDIDSITASPNPNYLSLSYRLSQADGALNFLYTSLDTNAPLLYMTNTNVAANYSSALVTQIPSNGVFISPGMIGGTLYFGIILVEAWTNTTAPLVLDVLEGTNVIAEAQLPLNITSVEQMFRHKNLTPAVLGAIDGPPDRLTSADVPNELDSNGTNFVFIHGYNVNPDQARGWESEIYKRMYWSGSHARFYGVTWDGYDTQVLGTVSISLHTNEIHAFQTAPALKTFLASLTGLIYTAAHSLGNMVTLASLNDFQATINSHYMIDGAVAIESVDGPEAIDTNMVPPDWSVYLNQTWAGEFFNLFPTNDYRSLLTWSNRLANFNGAKVYNFYSSGEEVLRNDPSAPLSLIGLAVNDIINRVWGAQPFAANLWCLSQKEKGRMLADTILGSYHGGWGYNTNYGNLDSPPNPTVVNALTPSQLVTNPVFDTEVDTALYQTNTAGSTYAQANQIPILSFSIPALTYAAGANFVTSLSQPGDPRNFDMENFENGWPASRSTGGEAFFWYHSDCREVAYLYTHGLFDELVTLGNLK